MAIYGKVNPEQTAHPAPAAAVAATSQKRKMDVESNSSS